MKGQVAPTKVLHGHNGSMMFVAFPSGDQIISASDDKTIRRFCVSDGRNEVLKEGVVRAIAMSPNRRWVAFGGSDGRVRLLDLETPAKITRSGGRHADVIKSLSFSQDSSQLASGAQDGTMLLWSSATLEPVAGPFEGHKDTVWCVCFSPDGSNIASCDREVIQIWETTTRIGLTICEPAWSLAWSSDGDILFAGCIDGSIKRINPNNGQLYSSCKQHTDVVSSILLSHHDRVIATASWDKTVRFFEAVTFQQIGPALKHNAQVHFIAISPDGNYLVSAARDPNIRIWNLRTIAPALFRPIPLEPVRGKMTRSISLHWPSSSRNTDFSHDFHGSYSTDTHGRISVSDSVEILEDGDRNSTKSGISNKSPISILRNSFSSRRKRGSTLDDLRIDCSSNQEGSHTDSPSPYTDRMSLRSESVSSHHPVEDPTVSPTVSVGNLPSSTPIPADESENWSFIREIRSDLTHDLTTKITPEDVRPVTGGSHGDIYRGTLHMNGKAMPVAIKAIKQYLAQGDDQSKRRRLRREINLWLKLEHKNIIPLLGTTRGYGDFSAMVCPWIQNGQLTSYLKNRKNDLTTQQRWCIINDVALGLQYLHSQHIVHGDISGANILIYGSGRACISDFGLSVLATNVEESTLALTYQVKGTLCWTAPELLVMSDSESTHSNEEEGVHKIFPTVQSDMYSFGGIMLLVLSGKRPYYHLPRDQLVILAISKGEYPKRPTSAVVVTDEQWEFMMQCWSSVAMDRPSDADMVKFVHEQLLSAVAVAGSGEIGVVADGS